MLSDVERAVAILRAVRDAAPGDVPLTASLRRAFDNSPESGERFERVLEAAWEIGCAAVRVHGRTVEQKYQGRSDSQALREIKARHPTRTILGSGDVFTAQDAVRLLRHSGVDGVWIARGAIGNPWIFRHAEMLRADAGAVIEPPSLLEQREALAEHFGLAMEIHGEELAGRRMRKMGIKYSRFHPQAVDVKAAFIAVRSLRDWNGVLERWYAADGPGVWPGPMAADEVNVADCEPAA
jgi:tRNA-dihydrouridine synthase